MRSAAALIRLLDELARMRGRTLSAFRAIPADPPLSEMESVVLTAVVGAQRPPTVSQIGRSLGHPRQVIQRTANMLMSHGLIEARHNPDHARSKLLVATDAGREIQAQRDAGGLRIAAEMVGDLDAALLERTSEGLGIIRSELERKLRFTRSTRRT